MGIAGDSVVGWTKTIPLLAVQPKYVHSFLPQLFINTTA